MTSRSDDRPPPARADSGDAVRHDLAAGRTWARDWLRAALPLWYDRGADRDRGGWFDKLDLQGAPVDLPKRLRVQARQAFVFAEAGRLGWDGPWRDAVDHGLDFMLGRFRRPDGLFRASVTRDGVPVADAPDLYDQAFVLFALAAGYAALGRPAGLLAEAEALLTRLEERLGHPRFGFEEARPRTVPLRSNPHMHLLEALLAWVEAGGGSCFERRADAIVDLCLDHLIDAATGAIGESYDGDWRFHNGMGHLREPGHQFEWAFLLHRAGQVLGRDHCQAWERLLRFGTTHGVRDGLAVSAVAADGTLADGSARLWAQTERLRAMLVLAPALPPADAALVAAADSLRAVRRFLDVPIRGLWRDRIDRNGRWIDEPSPASSLYHIVTGLVPLIEMRDGVAGTVGGRLADN
ncbi:AGE family epimerase/isomerase [Sphingomonas bacterium]|uniref:AGE family epimerase/isomerase n=1 Tax=Sphingomonas bacterium TaxID=1895847 RepID=UPI0020C6E93A|nr:AGE family epimerase/isomerase [Sphingomonas bacterium]